MIIIKILGGLGNQLFTYATAYALAKRLNVKLMLDEIIYHTNYSLRISNLDLFSISYNNKIINRSIGHNKFLIKLYNRFHKYLLRFYYNAIEIKEKEQFIFQEFNCDINKNYYLNGYWQNYKYFDNYREDLINEFKPLNLSETAQLIIDKISLVKPIAMHVRRGDYATFKGGKCLSLKYYKDAINYFDKCNIKNPIWVFTDDIEYCKNNIIISNRTVMYISENYKLNDIEEFFCMCKCQHIITANSTFSWWAAYLNSNINKIVISPVVDMWKESFYPNDWIKLKAEIK